MNTFRIVLLAVLLVGRASFGQPVTGDLVMNALTVSPSPASSGQTVNLNWSVSSIGNAGGIAQVTSYEVRIDGALKFSKQPLTVIANGSTQPFTDQVQLPSVSVNTSVQISVKVLGDTGQNQANNTASKFVTITAVSAGQPDLTYRTPSGWSGPIVASNVLNATTTPDSIPFGSTIYVNYSITNIGGTTPAGVPMALFLDNAPLNVPTPYPPMSNGAVHTEINKALPANLSAGNHTLLLRIDPDNLVPESSNGNNDTQLIFFVADPPRANLAFDQSGLIVSNTPNAATSTASMKQGDTAYVTVQYKNSGQLAAPAFNIDLRLNGNAVSGGVFRETASLGVGATRSRQDVFSIPNIPAGFLSFVVRLDSGAEVVESDESDNSRTQNVVSAAAICPTVTENPQANAVCRSGNATFTVKATGTAPLTYRWRKNSVPMNTSLNPSAATDTLSLTAISSDDIASYSCLVSNACGDSPSSGASLTLCAADFNCDDAVDDADFSTFVVAYNLLLCEEPSMPANCPCDLNGDGLVDDQDFSVFIVAYDALVCG